MVSQQDSPAHPLPFDEALHQRLRAVYMTPDVIEQRRQTVAALALRPGERVIDIGGGPGFLARDMAVAVGEAGRVRLVDSSESMVQAARTACAGFPWIDVELADAQHLGDAGAGFDAAVATQVLAFVPDVDAALAEAHRVLRPAGRLLVLETDSDSVVWGSSDRDLTARMLSAWDRQHADAHLPTTLSARLLRTGFDVDRVFVISIVNTHCQADTLSFHLSRQIAERAAAQGAVSSEEARAWLQDFERRDREGDYFFSLSRYVFLARRT